MSTHNFFPVIVFVPKNKITTQQEQKILEKYSILGYQEEDGTPKVAYFLSIPKDPNKDQVQQYVVEFLKHSEIVSDVGQKITYILGYVEENPDFLDTFVPGSPSTLEKTEEIMSNS